MSLFIFLAAKFLACRSVLTLFTLSFINSPNKVVLFAFGWDSRSAALHACPKPRRYGAKELHC